MRKTYNTLTNANHSEAVFIIGGLIGNRMRQNESVIVVWRESEPMPDMLKGELNQRLREDVRLAVLTGVGGVDEAVEFYAEQGSVHVIYYMPGFCKHADIESEQNQMLGLPVRIQSDTIRRQIRDPRVTTVTLFVDKEDENV